MDEISIEGKTYFSSPLGKQHHKSDAVLKTPAKGDWYIYYNIWDFVDGRWKPVKFYTNDLNTKEALALKVNRRLETGKVLLNVVNDTLKLGINPKTAKSIAPFSDINYAQAIDDARSNSPIPRIKDAITIFLKAKSGKQGRVNKVIAENKENTTVTYTSFFNRFLKFWEDEGLENTRMDRISKYQIYQYLETFYDEGIWGEVSYNNYLRILKGFFNHFAKIYDYQNVVQNIEKKEITEESERFAPFSENQIKEVFAYLDSEQKIQYNTHVRTAPPDILLSTLCRTIFYAFLRPSEISRLKIKHIKRYQEGFFDLTIDITKNKKASDNELYIEPYLVELYSKLGWEKYFKDKKYENYYIFTKGMIPSAKRASSYYFRGKFTAIVRKLNHTIEIEDGKKEKIMKSEWDDNFSLYSFKHAGNIIAFKAGFSLTQLQLQNRHASVQQTENYLRKLKQEINAGVRPIRPSY